jgi:hypothetical protein
MQTKERKKRMLGQVRPAICGMGVLLAPLFLPAAVSAQQVGLPMAIHGEQPIPPTVEAIWAPETVDSQQKLRRLQIALRNRVREVVSVNVEAICMGLGDEDATEALGRHVLAPMEERTLSIDARRLGIQSAASSAEVIVKLSIQRADGKKLTKFSSPLFYHFDEAFQGVTVYDQQQLLQKYNGGKIQSDPAKALGFKKDGTGRLVQIDKSPAALARRAAPIETDASGESRGTVISSSILVLSDDGQQPVQSLAPSMREAQPAEALFSATVTANASVRVCSHWKTLFEDSGLGEDFWTTASAHREAAYVEYNIHNAVGDAVVNSGVLNDAGCTTGMVSLSPGAYWLEMRSNIKKTISGQQYNYYIRYNNGSSRYHYAQRVDFSVTSGQSGTVTLRPANYYDFSNMNAIAGHVLGYNPPIVKPNTYNIWYGQQCPGFTDGSSCFDPSNSSKPVYVSQQSVGEKFVVAHEMGHQAAYFAYGLPYLSYSPAGDPGDTGTPELCRCDHVTTYNQLHCLQSREITSTAITEGFGYFWAAKIWNNTNGTDCILAHPKQVKMPNGTILQPPVAADCRNQVHWKFSYCDDSQATGTEWDWMQFFWNLHASCGTSNLTLDDIYDLIYRACGNATCNTADNLTWTSLSNAALVKWSADPVRLNNFYVWSNNTGVNQ